MLVTCQHSLDISDIKQKIIQQGIDRALKLIPCSTIQAYCVGAGKLLWYIIYIGGKLVIIGIFMVFVGGASEAL